MEYKPSYKRVVTQQQVGATAYWHHDGLRYKLTADQNGVHISVVGGCEHPGQPGISGDLFREADSLEEALAIVESLPEFGWDEAEGLGFTQSAFALLN